MRVYRHYLSSETILTRKHVYTAGRIYRDSDGQYLLYMYLKCIFEIQNSILLFVFDRFDERSFITKFLLKSMHAASVWYLLCNLVMLVEIRTLRLNKNVMIQRKARPKEEDAHNEKCVGCSSPSIFNMTCYNSPQFLLGLGVCFSIHDKNQM